MAIRTRAQQRATEQRRAELEKRAQWAAEIGETGQGITPAAPTGPQPGKRELCGVEVSEAAYHLANVMRPTAWVIDNGLLAMELNQRRGHLYPFPATAEEMPALLRELQTAGLIQLSIDAKTREQVIIPTHRLLGLE